MKFIPIFERTANAIELGARYLECRRCGQLVASRSGMLARHVSTWHAKDVRSGVIVRNDRGPIMIRDDAAQRSLRRSYLG